MKAIIGRKMGMTQVFAEDGTIYAVSVVEVLPNVVTQLKTVETDGYNAIQVGYEDKKESRATKPEKGIFAKAGTTPKYHLFELEGDEMAEFKLGEEIKVDLFKDGDVVDVSGLSKGKGFSGSIKRFHYKIGPKSHGSGYHRGVGSMAASGRIQTVPKGKKMPGHHGNTQTTVLNLIIVKVLPEKNAILIRGAIPGPTKSIVKIRSAIKTQLTKRSVKELLVRTAE
ncbi:MAG TPA: 50S ribosomal protein L3 [Bacilli bacterium]|nr:50S ribosomal protein L3 [Bacilli bacterium]